MSNSDSEQYDLLDQLAEEFAERFRRGERPSLNEYTDRYPELADEIRELFPAMVKVEQADGVRQREEENVTGDFPAMTPPLRQIGDYRIVREIGRGGMGVVYEAEQISLGRQVALKVLPGQVSGDRMTQERFRREARAAARLHHTNIVPVFEVGQDGDVRFYAMQFIQGMGLDAVITELRRLRDRARSEPKIKAASEGQSPRPGGEHSGQGIEGPTLGEGVEVDPVLRYILTGRFDPGDRGPEQVGASPSMLARALAGGFATPTGTGTESRAGGFDPAVTSTETGSATSGDTTGAVQSHPPAPALSPSASPSSSSAILPGGTQLSSVESGRRGFFRSLAHIGRQVAGGLAYAHARGIVHRDIKPANLLLDTEGVVWIADFGLAKGEDEGLTHTGDILGTLRYMSPERFRGEGDARADVYALGLTLYELLTLRPGFDSPDRLKLIEQIKTEEPKKPRSVDARIPRDLETIVLKAIDKDPKARYQSAEAMGEDLGRFLADEPIRARQFSAAERYWRWARRNPVIAVLGGVLTVVLIATTVGSMVAATYFRSLAGRESRANQQSQEDRKVAVEAQNDAVAAEKVAVAAQQEAILERDKAQRNEKAERWGRYRSNIAAASAALQLQNSDAARSALDDAPMEHRNWEWRYVHGQLDAASLVVPVPGGKIRLVVLSPSGRQIAVQCDDQNPVYLYDVATGRLDAVLRGHSAPATSVAYRRYQSAPATSVAYRPDGQQVATSSNDQTIRLWDPATGRQMALLKAEVAPSNLDRDPGVKYNSDGSRIASYGVGWGTSRLWDTTTGKEIAVLAKWEEKGSTAAFSPDDKRVAVRSREYVHLCDAATGRQLAVLGPHPGKVAGGLAYSPDGKRIASEGGSNAVYLWDGESGKEVAVLSGHTGVYITSMHFSPDGSRLVSASNYPDNTARLWEAATGRLLALLAGHKSAIWEVAFSPDGKRVATASLDQTGRLWDGRTGQSLAVLRGHTDLVQQVLFNPNGTRVVTVSRDATLRLWNAQTGDLIGVLRVPGEGDDYAPAFTPDGSRLVSGCADGAVRVWDLHLVEQNGVLRGHESYVYDVAFSPNGEQVASAAWDGTARLWDATTGRQTGLLKHETGIINSMAYSRDGRQLQPGQIPARATIINSVAYSRDGRQLATVERERGVALWDVASQKAERTWLFPAGYWAADPRAAFNPAGTLLAAGCVEGPVRLWDVPSGQEIAQLKGHEKCSADVAFHPDGHLLATGGEDGTVRLWNVATRASLAILRGHAGIVQRVLFSADGKLVASGSSDKTIRLWDVQTHEQLAVIPVGSMVYGLAFSPDGTRLAASCADSTIRLIDVATRQEVANLRGHTDYVHAVAWSPDGTRLVSGSGDFTVRIWDSLSPANRAQQPDALHPPR